MARSYSLLGAASVALVSLASTPAWAQATSALPAAGGHPRTAFEGNVVAIDGADFVVDLGALKGVHDGDAVELWRPVRLKHPVTGQMLLDRFRIGTMRLVQVQTALSIAKLDGEPHRAPATGDIVVIPESSRAPEPVATPAPPTNKSATPSTPLPLPESQAASGRVPQDPDAQALGDLMGALDGSDLATRKHAYQAFVKSRPKSRFAKVLREEIDVLDATTKKPAPAPFAVSLQPLERLKPGVAQRYAIELDPRFIGAVLHVRKKGAPSYRTIPMQTAGPRYWSATLPGDAIQEPGMEYFVEGVQPEGAPVAIVASAGEPKDVDVDARPVTGKQPGTLGQVVVQSELATFNAKKANDYVWQTEGTVGWRLNDVGMRAVRSGFGVLRGKGGTLKDLDELGKDPKSVGLTYGYVELELAPATSYAFIARPILGLREDGITGGAQGFVRIGNDLKTNLSFGGEILGDIGLRGIVELDWRTVPRVPIVLRTEVTNQPAGVGSDIGARAIAQVGYELVQDFAVSGRVSYQGRTINHAGPGAGLAVSYQW